MPMTLFDQILLFIAVPWSALNISMLAYAIRADYDPEPTVIFLIPFGLLLWAAERLWG